MTYTAKIQTVQLKLVHFRYKNPASQPCAPLTGVPTEWTGVVYTSPLLPPPHPLPVLKDSGKVTWQTQTQVTTQTRGSNLVTLRAEWVICAPPPPRLSHTQVPDTHICKLTQQTQTHWERHVTHKTGVSNCCVAFKFNFRTVSIGTQ